MWWPRVLLGTARYCRDRDTALGLLLVSPVPPDVPNSSWCPQSHLMSPTPPDVPNSSWCPQPLPVSPTPPGVPVPPSQGQRPGVPGGPDVPSPS
ncbi:hypothetical protein DV515_00018931 [Chloebia gouldiae]|uniref:Uncharacterized protein n=1 Tax=Chloebia gouldiae TaxID=44316 RepID=A0A3L8Q6F0_CHLGU|nr:hypothetical protein DV515_00018931 [Chloebia gouldiae]